MSNPAGKITDAILTEVSGVYDFSLKANGDIASEEFFDTATLMSLYCERRATPSEVPISKNRRGWIGNESTPGFEIGSKLWLLDQSKLTRTVLNEASSYAETSLKWMVGDGYALSVSASARLDKNNTVSIDVVLERPNSSIERRNYKLWENTGK